MLGKPEDSFQQGLCADGEADVLDSGAQQWCHNARRSWLGNGCSQTDGVVIAVLQARISVMVCVVRCDCVQDALPEHPPCPLLLPKYRAPDRLPSPAQNLISVSSQPPPHLLGLISLLHWDVLFNPSSQLPIPTPEVAVNLIVEL